MQKPNNKRGGSYKVRHKDSDENNSNALEDTRKKIVRKETQVMQSE